jgi:SAM-dependent methyltransferase
VDSRQWDERYSGAGFEWKTEPNQFVAAELGDLEPGRALDLAAGEGRNSVWLAERGWQVTAVDFSRVGLEKGRKLSAARGVQDGLIDWVVADLLDYEPPRRGFDLVLIAYLHLDAASRATVLGRAAAAVAPGGTLLVVGHDLANLTEGTGGPQYPGVLYTAEALRAELAAAGLHVLRAEQVRRVVRKDDGEAIAIDTLVLCHQAGIGAELARFPKSPPGSGSSRCSVPRWASRYRITPSTGSTRTSPCSWGSSPSAWRSSPSSPRAGTSRGCTGRR